MTSWRAHHPDVDELDLRALLLALGWRVQTVPGRGWLWHQGGPGAITVHDARAGSVAPRIPDMVAAYVGLRHPGAVLPV